MYERGNYYPAFDETYSELNIAVLINRQAQY